jgi:hypothetical protein
MVAHGVRFCLLELPLRMYARSCYLIRKQREVVQLNEKK